MEVVSSTTRPRSVFHRAASLALFAIVLAFLVKFVSAQTPAPVGVWLSWTAECMIFVAIPAGAMALAGIPKYGWRGLLWRGLVGVFVPIILFVVGMLVTAHLRESAQKLMQQSSSK
jgi:uncharacterized membrane protein